MIGHIEFKKIMEIKNGTILSADLNEKNEVLILYKARDDGTLKVLIKGKDLVVPKNFNATHIRWCGKNLMLVSGRLKKDEKYNALVIDAHGNTIESFELGDAIQNIDQDSKDNIWVGYFDEGIFGETIGKEGLVCFSKNHQILFRYHTDHPNLPSIDDCYAIAVDKKRSCVWVCAYSSWNLIKLDFSGKVIENSGAVPEEIIGASALAVGENNLVYLFSPYKHRQSLIEYDKKNKKFNVLRLKCGPETKELFGFGRGNKLILCSPNSVWIRDF